MYSESPEFRNNIYCSLHTKTDDILQTRRVFNKVVTFLSRMRKESKEPGDVERESTTVKFTNVWFLPVVSKKSKNREFWMSLRSSTAGLPTARVPQRFRPSLKPGSVSRHRWHRSLVWTCLVSLYV